MSGISPPMMQPAISLAGACGLLAATGLKASPSAQIMARNSLITSIE